MNIYSDHLLPSLSPVFDTAQLLCSVHLRALTIRVIYLPTFLEILEQRKPHNVITKHYLALARLKMLKGLGRFDCLSHRYPLRTDFPKLLNSELELHFLISNKHNAHKISEF